LDKSETIGFDMPKKEMGIEIKEGELYNVEIENKEGELIYRGCFRYTCDGCS